ncbi:MAG: DUF1028 domain-containing protein [Rhodocyclaceae bacterium]|nr:DUF1028 domain-containing protein [Rhodocyclaceae bacterium]
MTYSIIGRDPAAGEVGIAVQSKFPGVGSIVVHGRAGAGCLSTQAFANPDHGRDGLDLLALGATAAETLAVLLRGDTERSLRQIAVLRLDGEPAVHTGDEVASWDGWAGACCGPHSVASGNTLASQGVVEAMVEAFESCVGELSDRLIAGLAAGRDAGGELRGQQSAALLVVKPGGGYGGRTGRHVDVSIYDHPEPIDELARCYQLHRLSYFPSDDCNLVPIDAAIAAELKPILASAGFDGLPAGDTWDDTCVAAMARFMGVENYDNRIRGDALVDLEVLADIRRRHGAPSTGSQRKRRKA